MQSLYSVVSQHQPSEGTCLSLRMIVTRTNKSIPVHISILTIIRDCLANCRHDVLIVSNNGKFHRAGLAVEGHRIMLDARCAGWKDGWSSIPNLHPDVTRCCNKCSDKDLILGDLPGGYYRLTHCWVIARRTIGASRSAGVQSVPVNEFLFDRSGGLDVTAA